MWGITEALLETQGDKEIHMDTASGCTGQKGQDPGTWCMWNTGLSVSGNDSHLLFLSTPGGTPHYLHCLFNPADGERL